LLEDIAAIILPLFISTHCLFSFPKDFKVLASLGKILGFPYDQNASPLAVSSMTPLKLMTKSSSA